MEDSMVVPQKFQNRTTINPTSEYLIRIIESRILKRYLHFFIHCSIIYNTQEVKAPQMFVNRKLDKQNVIYLYIHTYTKWNIIQP